MAYKVLAELTYTKATKLVAFFILGRLVIHCLIKESIMFTLDQLLQNQECESIRCHIRELVRESRLEALRFARVCLQSNSLYQANLAVNVICEDLIPQAYR